MNAPDHPAGDWRAGADETLDTSGLRCPEPLMLLRNRVRSLAAGARVHVIATDPASVRDFEQFCSFLDHRIIAREASELRFEFLIEKGGR
ncbi:MAG: sulfurtransferase TusA [Pseudomonadales bacterium]|jgi:tRNA 2-thiouridine synthesizing protein A|nr:sulfurtransferase TusA [Pseudomonadales bacterium]